MEGWFQGRYVKVEDLAPFIGQLDDWPCSSPNCPYESHSKNYRAIQELKTLLMFPIDESDVRRPDYVACIARSHANHKNTSWCGRSLAGEWAFTDPSHAAENGLAGTRLVACQECAKAICSALITE